MSIDQKIELYILHKDAIVHSILPEHCEGSYSFVIHPFIADALLKIYAFEHQWWCEASKDMQFIDHSSQDAIALIPDMYMDFVLKQEHYFLFTSPYRKDTHRFRRYVLSTDRLTIGRSEECDIVYAHCAISFHHACIIYEEGCWHLQDLSSINGCFVNGKRVSSMALACKDRIQILELVLLVEEEGLYINHPKACRITSSLKQKQVLANAILKQEMISWQIHVPFVEAFAFQTYVIDMPPSLPQLEDTPFLLLLGPSVTMGISSLSMGVFSLLQLHMDNRSLLQSIPTLIMSLSMAISAILWPILTRRYHRKKQIRLRRKHQQAYQDYLCTIQQDILNEVRCYEAYMRHLHQDGKAYLQEIKRGRQIRYNHTHRAFLWMTLGYGIVPYKVCYEQERQGFRMEQELCDIREQLLQRCYSAKDVPIALNLKELSYIYITGEDRKHFLYQLLMQLALTHDIKDVVMVVGMNEFDAYTSGVLWLPHLYHDQTRYLITKKDTVSYSLDKHKQSLFFDFFDCDHIDMEQIDTMTHVCCRPQRMMQPSINSVVIHVEKEKGIVYTVDDSLPFHYELIEKKEWSQCARQLFYQTYHKSFLQRFHPPRFLDMYQCANIVQLNIWERWQRARTNESLRIPIGVNKQHKPLYLDLHERAHGPHGLIAGMTGSGKSECLLTMILALCIDYSPQQISFLLIDYKGGTMASLLQKLPHVAGVLTNLDTQQTQRAALSLQSELLRRQRLMNEISLQYGIGNMDIDQYDELSRMHPKLTPLAHLFIIADEFAELKVQQSGFLEQLKQLARIGRSLGIHLILSTQKPSGVIDDQIWSNAHFHLCMKVQSAQDSRDMLKKDDAVYLKKAGECCFQVGFDEVYEKGSIAWARCPYYPSAIYEEASYDEVAILAANGSVVDKRRVFERSKAAMTQMEAVVKALCECGMQHQLQAIPLWMEPIATHISVLTYPKALMMIDHIEEQKQYPLYIQDHMLTHTFLFGTRDESRSMYLSTFLYTLIKYPITDTILIFIFDFIQHDLFMFANHRGVIEVLNENDVEKVHVFFDWLSMEIIKRKQIDTYPPCLILVHGYEQFHERYASYEHVLQHVLQEGAHMDIYVFLSAASIDSIAYRLMQHPHVSIVFSLQEQSDYARIFGQTMQLQPTNAIGNGLMLHQGTICLFQTLITEEGDAASLNAWDGWERDYQLPTMPKHIAHRVLDKALYLGKQLGSIRDLYLNLTKSTMVYICTAFRFSTPAITLWMQQLAYQDNVCIVCEHRLRYRQKSYTFAAFHNLLPQVDIIVWNQFDTCDNEAVTSYLRTGPLQDDKHHVFVFTMREQTRYQRYEWFAIGFYEADILWVGKGISEYRHLFKNMTIPLKEIKRNEGYLITEEACTALQLWEEEASE